MKKKLFFVLVLSLILAVNNTIVGNKLIDLSTSDNGLLLKDTLVSLTESATIILKRGVTYNLAATSISQSVKIKSAEGDGNPAILNMAGSSLNITGGSALDTLMFEDVEISGDVATGYLMNFGTNGSINQFILENVKVHHLRGVFRCKDAGIKTIQKFTVNNSLVDSIGGYGVMQMDNAEAYCANVVFSNSTFSFVYHAVRWRSTQNVNSVVFNNCTFHGTPLGGYIIRLDDANITLNNPMEINNCILGLAADKLKSGNVIINCNNTYATSDCEFSDTAFGMAPIKYAGASSDLWTDPANRDFSFKDLAFAGKKSTGDPRYITSLIIDLSSSDNPELLKDTLSSLTESATIILKRGLTYGLSATIISQPVTIKSAVGTGSPAILDMAGSSLDIADGSAIDELIFEDLEILGDVTAGYLMNFSTRGSIGKFILENVYVHNLRGIFRAKNNTLKNITLFSVNNSIIDSIGGYGIMQMDVDSAYCDSVFVSNSTFTNLDRGFRWRSKYKDAVSLKISGCDFYNAPYNGEFIRLDNVTITNGVEIKNTIFGLSNNKLINGTVTINCTNTYSTSDNQFVSTGFNVAPTAYSGSSTTLWVDPVNGDFFIKDGSFAGKKTAGDPRWVVISSNANLVGITLNPAAVLSPAFDKDVTAYTVAVPTGTASVSVSVTKSDTLSSVNGEGVVDLSSGTGTATIVVTAEDGTSKTYTVVITVISNDATLSNIAVNPGALSPTFSAATLAYTVSVPFGTASVTVTATKNDAKASVAGDGAIDVSSGSGTANIIVTAEDGTTTKTYTVAITVEPGSSDATLSGISVNGNAIADFDAATLDYTVDLPAGTTQIPEIIPYLNDPKSSVVIDLPPDLTGKVIITVTSEDGTSKKIYRISFNILVNIDINALGNIQIYPNPAGNYVMLEGLYPGATVKIINALGEIVHSSMVSNTNIEIGIANLAAGIYLVNIEINGQVYTSRFIKK